ncbi:hypothetical protein CL617_04615 [archaeon]|nr:hypothetical protein [archaeon]|tara:strand:+ start:4573 stop:5628 length:1056 start_codon:yes stop_codon:yes gene_type:complete
MRILICSDVYPGLRGIAQYSQNVSKILCKNHEVTILCQKKNYETEEIIMDVKVYRVEEKNIMGFMQENRNNFDLILVRYYKFLLQAINNFKNVIYIIPSVRSMSIKFMDENGRFKNEKEIERISEIERNGILKCKKLICSSKSLNKQVQKEYNFVKGIVIPHGVNLNKFKPNKQSKKKYDVVTVANFDPRKGIDKLISVAKKSRSNFIILGDGKLKKTYKRLILENNVKDKIQLLGQKNPLKYLQESKIFVLPSIYESFGLVLLEAMASGLPCIAFRPDGKKITTASDEIIKDGKTGFLVNDEKEMSEKINLLVGNKKLREKMSKASRKEAERYSWDKSVESLLKEIEKIT